MARSTTTKRHEEPLFIIEPGRKELRYWGDVWSYRDLFIILAWRDIAVRYKQTVLGVAWAMIRPLLTVLIFTVVFGKIAKLPAPGTIPYPLLVLAGMLPWFLFSSILSDAANSLLANANLVSKVYFPRILIPASSGAVALVDLAINIAIFFLIAFYYGFWPNWQIVVLPGFIVLAALVSFGPALLIVAFNVKYRDFRYIIPFLVQLGLYMSPVGFSSDIIPDKWRFWYSLNPLVGIIDGFRWCLLGGESQIYLPGFLISIATSGIFLWLGISYFRHAEKTFADLI